MCPIWTKYPIFRIWERKWNLLSYTWINVIGFVYLQCRLERFSKWEFFHVFATITEHMYFAQIQGNFTIACFLLGFVARWISWHIDIDWECNFCFNDDYDLFLFSSLRIRIVPYHYKHTSKTCIVLIATKNIRRISSSIWIHFMSPKD